MTRSKKKVKDSAGSEQERKQDRKYIGELRESFSKAFKHSPIPMSITTLKDGRFIDVNNSFLKSSGYSRKELLGHTSLALGMVQDKDRTARLGGLHGSHDLVRVLECVVPRLV